MYDDDEVAFQYQHRAEETRTMAEGTRDALARHLLLRLASEYERAAEMLRHVSATEREVRGRLTRGEP